MTNKKIKQLVVDAMFIALLVVSSFISIPINQIPYTLQTLVVFIVLLMLDCKNGIIVAESAADKALPPMPAPYRLYREYRYGQIKLTVFHRDGNED